MTTIQINKGAIIYRNLNQPFSEIDGEVVMLNVASGEYYSLDIIGSSIWKLLGQPIRFSDLISELLIEFDTTYEVCSNDTKEYLQELIKNEIIQVKNE